MKTLAALALTPWAIFITSSSSVYLQNQEEFDYEYQVYGTMFLVASLVTVVGFLLFKVSKKSAVLQSMLAAYYVFGPAIFNLQRPAAPKLDAALGHGFSSRNLCC